MREILFRGKRKKDGVWVYGNYAVTYNNEKQHFIFKNKTFEVDPETVGQYTGLTDKNLEKIFEGDILYCTARLDRAIMVVIYEDAEFRLVPCDRYKLYTTGMGYKYFGSLITKVIGNIHDNPELLEV